MQAVQRFAADGGLVLGICNGFQILVEAGLLPGALIRNRGLKFICRELRLRVATTHSPFTCALREGQVLRMPIAHGEGCYFAEPRTLDELEAEDRVAFRYLDNPNGSLRDIAGILNRERNVMGMMPHPERASDPLMGSSDGLGVFQSMLAAVASRAAGGGGAAMSTIAITPDLIAQHQLTPDEYRKIVEILGREPSYTELGIFSVMWSEHCSYKSSRLHLKKLPTRGKLVVQGPGENAGIIDIGGGYVIAFKIESHNHPSFIEPFQGAATGSGGILRDIFTMGARPIAVLDSLRFGRLDDPEDRRAQPPHPVRRGGRHRPLRQLLRRAHGGRRVHLRTVLRRQPAGERVRARRLPQGRRVLRQGRRRRQSGDLRGRAHRPRRHPRRLHGQRRIHRGVQAEAPQRAGGRSVHGKAAAGGLHRSHAHRRHRRHSGHGRGRPHLLDLRDGQPRRGRHRNRAGQGAAARNRHDAVRDHALGIAGAHAAGGRRRPRAGSLPGVPQVGTGGRRNRQGHRRWPAARPPSRGRRGRDPQPRAGR